MPPDFTSPQSSINFQSVPSNSDLLPPTRPFGASRSDGSSFSSNTTAKANSDVPASLSVNYLPTKFSAPHSPGVHVRKAASNQKHRPPGGIRGGGREAFSANAARMPGVDDDDYDGVQVAGWALGKRNARLRWNRFKWILLLANTLVRCVQWFFRSAANFINSRTYFGPYF